MATTGYVRSPISPSSDLRTFINNELAKIQTALTTLFDAGIVIKSPSVTGFNPITMFDNGLAAGNRGWAIRIGGSADLQVRTTDDSGTPQLGGLVLDVGRVGNNVTSINFGDATSNPNYEFFGTGNITFDATPVVKGDSNRLLITNTAGAYQVWISTVNSWLGSGSTVDGAIGARGSLNFYANNNGLARLSIAAANNAYSVAAGNIHDFAINATSYFQVTTGAANFANHATTVVAPAAGGAGALPATPLGYVTLNINGVARKVAYY